MRVIHRILPLRTPSLTIITRPNNAPAFSRFHPAIFLPSLRSTFLPSAQKGHVAQWILKELQDEAVCWVTHMHKGKPFYYHEVEKRKSWVKPAIVVAMEETARVLDGDRADCAGAAATAPPLPMNSSRRRC